MKSKQKDPRWLVVWIVIFVVGLALVSVIARSEQAGFWPIWPWSAASLVIALAMSEWRHRALARGAKNSWWDKGSH